MTGHLFCATFKKKRKRKRTEKQEKKEKSKEGCIRGGGVAYAGVD